MNDARLLPRRTSWRAPQRYRSVARLGALGRALVAIACGAWLFAGATWSPVVRTVVFGSGVLLVAGSLLAQALLVAEAHDLGTRLTLITRRGQLWLLFDELDEESQREIKRVLDSATVRVPA